MEPSIFKYILRYSARQQVFLLCVILAYYPFLYLSLELPKLIVNRAIEDPVGPPFGVPIFGYEFKLDLDQIPFLLVLCFGYLFFVFCNGGFKYYINVYKGQMGERLLRRLRYQLYNRILRFPLQRFRKTSQGELIPIITAEVEPLGGFIGTAYADPLFFGGQLVIILTFIMVQDPMLGMASIALYPVQMYVIPKLQRKVNLLGKERVQNVRRLSEHIGESVAGVVEVHANDTSNLELSRFAERLGRIYEIRYEIYRRKFFIKFLNNFIDKLTPFFFFSIGGYLVIAGDLTFGALVAVLAAYKELAAPWKELLTWYQQKEDVRIKYEQVIEQFDPDGMLPSDMQEMEGEPPSILDGELVANNVAFADEDGARLVDGASFKVDMQRHTAIVGAGASGKQEFAMLLARLMEPTRGKIAVGDSDLSDLPEAVTGRRMAYVGPQAYLCNGTIGDNLVYGLKHRPLRERDGEARSQREITEAQLAGNIEYDYQADWVDYAAAGVSGPEELKERIIEVLHLSEFERDVYQIGLRGVIDPAQRPDVAERILTARKAFSERVATESGRANLVERFDIERYNRNASLGENLLFGIPVDDRLGMDSLSEHAYVRKVLDELDLTNELTSIGRQVAATMIEIFADLPPDHEFFEQYSFIAADDLEEFESIVERSKNSLDNLEEDERRNLMALSFLLVAERHRLGLIDNELETKILEARRAFRAQLPENLSGAVAFFDDEAYCPAASLQDNILFGKVAYGHAHADTRVGDLMQELIEELELTRTVVDVGLEFPAGVGGARLTNLQRQKLAISRALLKRSDMTIINEATEALDVQTQERVIANVLEDCAGRGVIWVMNRAGAARHFDHVLVMQDGRVAEQGPFDELNGRAGAFKKLLDAA
ncbi:MAG: multidrug transporter [Rhodospirillaceae bacterium]|nr:multidrug transporter [Rhodospirillaceae bacterium]